MSAAADRRRAQATGRLVTQSRLVTEWYAARSPDQLTAPTRLDGWDVFTLGAHLVMMLQGATAVLDQPTRERPHPLHAYVARYRPQSDDIEERTRTVAAAVTDLPAALTAATTALADRLAADWPDVVAGIRGPLRSEDFVASRILEAITHSDDLNATELVTNGDAPPVPIDAQALGAVCRTLAAMLEERYPGRTVEVRVPPYAAIQCGTADHAPSPTHTRGTPPNVIELEPLVFVRLGTGRLSWTDAAATGSVRASGIRADLTGHLPLLS